MPRLPERKIEKTPSPLKYDTSIAEDKTTKRCRSPTVLLSKSPRSSYLDKIVKDAKESKGPGAYNCEKAYSRVTLGARRGYK